LAPFAFGVFGGLENAAAFEFCSWGIGAEDGAARNGGRKEEARKQLLVARHLRGMGRMRIELWDGIERIRPGQR
jgi:hypothetical protein